MVLPTCALQEKPQTLKSFAAYGEWTKQLHFSDPQPKVRPASSHSSKGKDASHEVLSGDKAAGLYSDIKMSISTAPAQHLCLPVIAFLGQYRRSSLSVAWLSTLL